MWGRGGGCWDTLQKELLKARSRCRRTIFETPDGDEALVPISIVFPGISTCYRTLEILNPFIPLTHVQAGKHMDG